MQTTSFRGHKLKFIDGRWVYADTGEEIPPNGGKIRHCVKCKKFYTPDDSDVDPCLGMLPGVDAACCGHGDRSISYIRFTNGVVIRNFVVESKPTLYAREVE